MKEFMDLTETERFEGWDMFHDIIVEQIKRCLVTDQEKFAFSFFFLGGYAEEDFVDAEPPGEVLFF